jgi:hypothetical protein
MFHSMRRKAHGTGRRQPWQAGYAVRRDWPDGTHELIIEVAGSPCRQTVSSTGSRAVTAVL